MSRRIVREAITPTNFTRGGDPYRKLGIGSNRRFKHNDRIRILRRIYVYNKNVWLEPNDILTFQEFKYMPKYAPYFFRHTPYMMVHNKALQWIYDNPDAYERLDGPDKLYSSL